MYMVYLLKSDNPRMPWRSKASWQKVRGALSQIEVILSHIYKEGNCTADKLVSLATDNFQWWDSPPDELLPYLCCDLHNKFYRFVGLFFPFLEEFPFL